MADGRIVSVNSGVMTEVDVGGEPVLAGIDKRPRPGRVAVGLLGLDGDEFSARQTPDGPDRALCAYAREDLDWWTERLGRELRDGQFGESITTSGVDIAAAGIGETWRLGTAVVQLTEPRIPCATFQAWIGEGHWVRRLTASGRTGAMFRVLAPGSVAAGDEIEVLGRPERRVTVAEAVRAYCGDRELMRAVLAVPGRAASWDRRGERLLGRPA